MPEDDALAAAEADNYRRAAEGHRAPDSEQPPVAVDSDQPEVGE